MPDIEDPLERKIIAVELITKEKSFRQKLVANVPLFISALALALSLWSAYATRLHNTLSVRPAVNFVVNLAPIYGDVSGLQIRNEGFGPAKISELKVYLDGKIIRDWTQVTILAASMMRSQNSVRWGSFDSDISLRPGEAKQIYTVNSQEVSNTVAFNNLIQKRIFVIVKVCSIYEECNMVCSTVQDSQCTGEKIRITKN